MILKKVEKENIVKAIYKSSNVLASQYDKTKQELTITFNRGSVYTYAGVPATDYTRFEIAESQGKILNSHIKKYEFTKGDDVDPTEIIGQIEKHKAEELKEIEASIIKVMDKAVSTYSKKGTMDIDMLTRVQYLISKYNNEKNS